MKKQKIYYGCLDFMEADLARECMPRDHIAQVAERRRKYDPDGKKALALARRYHEENPRNPDG